MNVDRTRQRAAESGRLNDRRPSPGRCDEYMFFSSESGHFGAMTSALGYRTVVSLPFAGLRARAALRGRPSALVVPLVFVMANAVAFFIARPGVPDLWAARARASGVRHGVGLTYWFGWFGGSTPGSYSVITPFVCAVVGVELVAALAAVMVTALATLLLRETHRPVAAAWVAAFGVLSNLWCGRVPFLLGAAFAVGALVCVRRRRGLPAAVLAVCGVLASPVTGAFVALGVAGTLLGRHTQAHRAAALWTTGAVGASLGAVALLFGAPGPEPFPAYLLAEVLIELALMWWAAPRGRLRLTLVVSAVIVLVDFAVPNGMGSNIARLSMFCLPVVVVATSRRRPRLLALLMAPALVLAVLTSSSALVSAAKEPSTVAYYVPLAAELDRLHAFGNQRLEIIGADHAANAILLDHAVLARGWETQTDQARNSVLFRSDLDRARYRRWLDDNAVGLIAVSSSGGQDPERHVVGDAGRSYLHEIWRTMQWRLYEVRRPTPIVGPPAQLRSSDQASMTLHVACACTATIRVRWSPYLTVSPALPAGTPDAVEDSYRPTLRADDDGWATLTTDHAGTYVLSGSA